MKLLIQPLELEIPQAQEKEAGKSVPGLFFIFQNKSSLNQRHSELSFARAIEFAEKDPLPGPERQVAGGDRDGDGWSEERHLDMGIGIALGVAELRTLGHHLLHPAKHVGSHIWIVALVDGHCSGSVGAVDDADAVIFVTGIDNSHYMICDVENLVPPLSVDGNSLHLALSPLARYLDFCPYCSIFLFYAFFRREVVIKHR